MELRNNKSRNICWLNIKINFIYLNSVDEIVRDQLLEIKEIEVFYIDLLVNILSIFYFIIQSFVFYW